MTQNSLTNVESSFPVKVSSIDGDCQVDVTCCENAGHDADDPVAVDVFAYDVLRVEAADDAPVGIETRASDVDHHSAHHIAALWGERQWL